MEEIMELIGEGYAMITLSMVIFGYVVTTTPYLEKIKSFLPLIVTILGTIMSVIMFGNELSVMVYGALAGVLSSGLYELFGKGIKNLAVIIGKKYGKGGKDDEL